MNRKILTSIALTTALCLLAPAATRAQNLLENPDFSQVNSQGPYSTHTASPTMESGGQSGAEYWTTWAPPGGTVSTFLMPSFFPGDGGNTHSSMTLTEKGKWERITVSNGISPANEITIYTAGTGAYFYVTYASVSPGPSWDQYECCTPAELGAGF